MSNHINHADIETAVDQLTKSDKGKQTAIDLLAMLERGAISLDEQNQGAVNQILAGVWGGLSTVSNTSIDSGAALNALRDMIWLLSTGWTPPIPPRGAVEALLLSDKDKQTAIDLLAMLERDAISPDEPNQAAVQTILAGAWGGLSGTALDALRDRICN